MKTKLSLILSVLAVAAHGQTITGRIIDVKTKQPVAYANIGFYRKQLGTISDLRGNYQLSYKAQVENDTVRVSSVGYKPVFIKFSTLRNHPDVLMEENTIALQEVRVKGKGLTNTRVLGNTKDNDNINLNLESNQPGTELGTVIHLKRKPSLLVNAGFNIADNQVGELVFRVNLYRLVDGELTEEKLLNKDLIVTTTIRTGTFTVDLSPYRLVLEDDFLLTLEWVKTDSSANPHGQLFFNAGLGYARNEVYTRYASQSNWVREDDGIAGMKPKLSFFVTVKD